MPRIVLLDPGIPVDASSQAKNIGDSIISEAINNILKDIFPNNEIVNIASHKKRFNLKDLIYIKRADYVFIGGTNLLSNYTDRMNRPLRPNGRLDLVAPKLKNVILFGVGWGHGYGVKDIELQTIKFYRKIFKKGATHSVRDYYSETKMLNNDFDNVVNTNCPTMWELNGLSLGIVKKPKKVIFTLTDYSKDYDNDGALIDLLSNNFEHVFFFPQGSKDEAYLRLLEQYQNNKDKITVIDRSLASYDKFIKNNEFVYIGTRLHGGIRCLQNNKPALILSVDNRAESISKDTHLPVVHRSDLATVESWLKGEKKFNKIKLNLEGINRFVGQF